MNLNIENASSEVQCVGLNNSSTFINMAGAILTIDQLPFTGSTAVNNKKIITNNGQIIIRHLNLGNAIWGDGAESDFTNNNLIKVDSGCGGGIYLTDSAKFENRDSIDIYRCHSVGLFASGASDFTNQGYLKIRSNLSGTFTGMSLNSGASVTNGLGNEIQLENLTAHRGIDLESSSLDNFGAIQVINSVFNFSVLELENAEMEVNYNSTIFLDTP